MQAELATSAARAEELDSLVRFEVRDANHLRPDAETFDVVWVIECSEHLADKARCIDSCARALRPGGVLALCAWLAADDMSAPGHARLVDQVCQGMLCPQLASRRDYTGWMRQSGFTHVEADEITRNVEETWTRCALIASRPEIKALLRVLGEPTRRFVGAFAAIRQAYAEGAMAYGMFTAVKP